MRYRLYFMNLRDHIDIARDIECGTDAEALEIARTHPDPRKRELWLGTSRIATLSAPDHGEAGLSG